MWRDLNNVPIYSDQHSMHQTADTLYPSLLKTQNEKRYVSALFPDHYQTEWPQSYLMVLFHKWMLRFPWASFARFHDTQGER